MASRIVVRGPWLWTWATWGAVRTVLIFWGAYVGYWYGFTQQVHLVLLAWYTLFMPLELVGAWRLKHNPPGVEIAKTWSQINQRIASHGRWHRWVATINAAADAGCVIMILTPWSTLSPMGGVFAAGMGGLLGWRLMPHFHDRSDLG